MGNASGRRVTAVTACPSARACWVTSRPVGPLAPNTEEAGLPDLMVEAAEMTDPGALLGLLARASRQVRERCGDILAVLDSGAAVEPEIAATRAEGARRNRLGVEMVVERIRGTGGRVDPRATDIAVALMSAGLHESLVVKSGWSHHDYEAWLRRTLVAAVLCRPSRTL